MQRWVSKGYKPLTLCIVSRCLRQLVRHLERCGAPAGLSAWVPNITNPGPRTTTATEEERALLIEHADPPLRLLILLCSDLAIRSGTAALINPTHRNREQDTLEFKTKFGRFCSLPLTDQLRTMLDALDPIPHAHHHTPYVAMLAGRHSYRANSLRYRFAALRDRLGVQPGLGLHDLRRTTAVHALNITGDLRVVQALLGHSYLASTFGYLDHRATPVKRELLEAAKLNRKSRATLPQDEPEDTPKA